ncbi:MAG TPA: ammonium transporter [Candidatus Handelsmanbacteria bacterium]|nr:ammonium transporter [Candidatus Handelsmanbacteria bacterium]
MSNFHKRPILPCIGAVVLASTAQVSAEGFTSVEAFQTMPLAYPKFMVDNLWVLISAALVFIMHLGFATLETGLTRQKNTVNILFKNLFILSSGILTYALCGFNIMYPGDEWIIADVLALKGAIGFDSDVANLTNQYADYTYWSDFIFQAMFAATAATIVSGAVAERVKLSGFMLYAVILVTLGYTVAGSWKWGGGWLDDMGFYDFAGSSVVHTFGGFSALAAVLVLGPRRGKYVNGEIRPILGHSMPLSTIGVFLLWLGWFGFNGGSVLSADPAAISLVFVTTSLAAAAGCMASIFTSFAYLKKPDITMALNGILAGLVGITAGADVVTWSGAILIGLIAGVIVVFAIVLIDRIKIDDPVGAISVHGICGIWGTVAVGIFSANAEHSIVTQLCGTLSYATFAFVFSLIVTLIIKATLGFRVDAEEEDEGLDLSEHGQPAYADFDARTQLSRKI